MIHSRLEPKIYSIITLEHYSFVKFDENKKNDQLELKNDSGNFKK